MRMDPVVDGLENEFGDQIEFLRIDSGSSDGLSIFRAYGLRGHPCYVMINPDGEVLWIGLGEQSVESLRGHISKLLVN